jgi:hypothetical protein
MQPVPVMRFIVVTILLLIYNFSGNRQGWASPAPSLFVPAKSISLIFVTLLA